MNSSRPTRFLIYGSESEDAGWAAVTLDSARYSVEFWRPSWRSPVPPKKRFYRDYAWTAMHYLHLFANRDYGMCIISEGGTVVHRSTLFPPYYSFPFMAKKDLQIGLTWTHPEYRGKQLATFAIRKILEVCGKPYRKFWYIVEESNIASIRVAEKARLIKIGEGIKRKRFGISFLGYYEIEKRYFGNVDTL